MMKTPHVIRRMAAGTLALVFGAGTSHAANVSLIASDASTTPFSSSYSTGLHWSDSQPPSAANDYNTAGFVMRTPGDGGTNYVFAGASLTLAAQNVTGGTSFNGSILEKFSGAAGTVRWLTINNLTNAPTALLRSGGTAGASVHIQGNHFTIAGTSAINADQCIWVIDSPLLGADNVILTNFANNANDHVSYTGTNSGFTGSWYLTGAGNSAWSVELDSVYSLPGNPSSFNPGQLTFLGTSQLRDTAGCSITNSNGGITFAANATINTSVTTLIGEPITDMTNGVASLSRLTSSGTGTLILSNANNNYSGGTTISAGTLLLGVDNAIPGNTVAGDVTVTGTLDLNGHNLTINGLTGAGIVDTVVGGTPTLTVGANGNSGTFSGSLVNSAGALSVVKLGAGTETFSGNCSYSGATIVRAGTLVLNPAGFFPPAPGGIIISNSGVLQIDATGGTPLSPGAAVIGPNGTLNVALNPSATGLSVTSLTFQDNATNNFNFGPLFANPTAASIDVAGGLAAPGTNIVLNIAASGLQAGTFPLIKYTGASLPSLANFTLVPPLGVVATLVNNTGNHSIDINITLVPDNVTWNGVGGANWDLTTVNWAVVGTGNFVAFRQGDGVTFDDTVTNDFVNPQPTNINLTAAFSTYPIPGLIMNNTLPYTFTGAGGLAGPAPLILTNSGSLTLLTSNSFTGGVSINNNGSLIVTNDSALGASSGGLTLNGGTFQMNGPVTNSRAIAVPLLSSIGVATNVTSRLSGVISGAAASLNKIDNGTLVLAGKETFTGNLFIHNGTVVVDSGGSITNSVYHDVGQNNSDNATLILRGTGNYGTANDFNAGDLDSSVGTVNIQDSATLTANQIFVGSANAPGSTASGTFNQSGGTVTEVSTAVGAFSVGGRNSVSGVGVYNMTGGTLTAFAGMRIGGTGTGTMNQSGGTINARQGINIARIAGSFGTNNLNGGTLATFNVSSSTGSNAVFNFNGGTLQAAFSPPSATWFSGNIQANVLDGGAIIDTTSSNNVTISTPLLAGSLNGGLTKKGTATLTLTGTNTFTGPITNTAGSLLLNTPSTYAGGAYVNAGTLQVATGNAITGPTVVTNGAVLGVSQVGSGNLTLGNLTFNGGASGLGAVIALTPTTANNPAVPMVNCGTLTLNGTNTISLAAVNVGALAVIKYTGAIAGSGNITNLSLPQGATGFLSNDVPDSILYVVVTSSGPGLVWTGTNTTALNTWNINATTNWLVNATPTSYHQIITPGDAVIFNDVGNGTVLLNTNVAPASLVISNSSKSYTFSGSGNISGTTGLKKLGSSTAIWSLTNNSYSGDTTISNGTLQAGASFVLSSNATLVVGSAGTLQVAGFDQKVAELTGSGVVDNSSAVNITLTVGSSAGGAWNGTIQDHGLAGTAIAKTGSGTWVVSGTNNLGNNSTFSIQNIFSAGKTIVTNGGSLVSPLLQTFIANGAGSTATMIVDGGILSVQNNILTIGNSTNANGTLIVNNGTVIHGGNPNNNFGNANNIFVGGIGGTGTLTVNGGQVLNSQALVLGQNPPGSGTLNLNGGLVQATAVVPNGTPAVSLANFNGGTLQAVTNSGDYLQVTSMIMSNGLVLDDGGYSVTLASQPLQAGDAFNGGLIKKGSGAVYLDNSESYSGATIVTNGLLAGFGSVSSPVIVGPNGRIGGGDSVNLGTFTAFGDITMQGGAFIRINKDNSLNDVVASSGKITYGGTLVVSNLSTIALNVGDTFSIFAPGTHTGNFSSISGSPGAGLGYSFDPNSGQLSIVTSTIATNPTNITFSASGGSLNLTWPADHQGWTLQSNSVSLTSSANWFDYPAATGSRDTTSVTIPTTGTTNNVYFRLKYP